jgi:hypothetical protein
MKLTDEERALCLKYKATNGSYEGPGICKGFDCILTCPIGKRKTEICSQRVAYETAVKLLNEDERNNNMSEQLTITKEKVLEAAAKCSTAKEVLKTIFPEVFVETYKYSDFHSLSETSFLSIISTKLGLSSGAIQVEASSNEEKYNYHGFFLSKISLDWTLYDNGDHYTLIPTKK